MPTISVDVSGDHAKVSRQVGADRLPVIHTTADWMVDAMEHGMASGATSLMVLIPAQLNGVDVLVAAETSLSCWMSASAVLAAAHPDEVDKPGYANLSPVARAHLGPRFAEAVRRAVPSATPGEAIDAANMIMDGFAADGPPVEWTS